MMKLSQQLKSSLLIRYVFYYFLIFFLPFIVLATLTYRLSLNGAREQFKNAVINELASVERQFTDQLEGLTNIALNIRVNDALSPFLMEQPLYGRNGIQMLSSYIASQDNIEDVILYYFSNDSRYYSSQGFHELQALRNRYYEGVEISESSLEEIYYLSDQKLILLENEQDKSNPYQLQYVVPLRDAYGTQYGTILFLFKQTSLKRILPVLDGDQLNRVYIINEDGLVLLSNDLEQNPAFVSSDGKLLADLLVQSTYKASGVEYQVEKTSSEELGFRVVSVMNSHGLVTEVVEARNFVMTLLFSLFLLGVLLIGFASYLQYLPIKKMYVVLTQKKEQESIMGESELAGIQRQVTHILNQNEILALENKSLHYMSENQALLGLIEEGTNEEHHWKQQPFIQDLMAMGVYFYVVMIRKDQLSTSKAAQIQQLFPIKKAHYRAYMVQIPLQNKLAIFVSHTQLDLSSQESLKDLEHEINSVSESIYFYYGQGYDDLAKIKHSYIEAMIACDYLVENRKERFISYHGKSAIHDQFLEYPVDMETKWIHSINQATGDVAIDSMKQIFQFLSKNQSYLEEVKVYSFYLINLIMKTAATVGLSREKIHLEALLECQTLEALEEQLLELTTLINQSAQSKRELERGKFHEAIFSYILNHYTSPELSLEFLSEKYDYSMPYLSKMIKEETGVTFTKYVQDLRLNCIKKQLVETSKPIKDIINESGYYDVSNFSRKFKHIMGVTPGQYRTFHRDQKEKVQVNK